MSSVQPSILLFLLLLCIFMHACNSRPLGKHSVKKVHHLHPKVSGKKIQNSAFVVNSSMSKGIKAFKTHETGGATQEVNQEMARDPKASVTKEVYHQEMKKRTNPKASFRVPRKKQVMGDAGNRVLMSFNEDLQHSSNILEGFKRRARSILGSNSHDTEESVGSKEYDTVQDVMTMDYQNPHRKSPIHNLSP